jgi:hypothetical protein
MKILSFSPICLTALILLHFFLKFAYYFKIDLNTFIAGFPNCHTHLLSANNYDYGQIRFPVALTSFEYVNSTHPFRLRHPSPFNKQQCLSHILVVNFAIDSESIKTDPRVGRSHITWKLEYYWRGYDKFADKLGVGSTNIEQSNAYMNIITTKSSEWSTWIRVLHPARFLVFQKLVFYFLNEETNQIQAACVCYNCNKGKSTLVPWKNSTPSAILTGWEIDALKDIQIRNSNGLQMHSYQTVHGFVELPMDSIPEPESLIQSQLDGSSLDWPLYVLLSKLLYRECPNATFKVLQSTTDFDIYSMLT